MKYKGVIFDLDGVICSTDEYHYLAWKALADRLCIPFDLADNNRMRGIGRMESLEIVLEKSPVVYFLDSVYLRSSQNSQPNSDASDMNSGKERGRVFRIACSDPSPAF